MQYSNSFNCQLRFFVLFLDESDFYFDENAVPPPMSLSAPELGAEELEFEYLRNASSSTELLHERAMIRIYQAAEAEERELEKRRQSLSIPKIRINSKDEENIVGLERNQSLKRRLSAGGVTHQQVLWAQRRHSLKTPSELKEELVKEKSLRKYPSNVTEKRELMMTRERSESEEKEELLFEDLRRRTGLQDQSSFEKRQITIADEDKWADDYVSSTEEESEMESSSVEMLNFGNEAQGNVYDSEEETYHPRLTPAKPVNDEEPFEILTKRKEPPSPDFIPKPILKKPERSDLSPKDVMSRDSSPKGTLERSSSPVPKNIFKRARSHSLADTAQTIKSFITEKPKTSRKRSSSIATAEALPNASIPSPGSPPVTPNTMTPSFIMNTISTVAQITGITAASIVIPEKLLEKQRAADEARVVIDHYGDIVKNYGSRRKSNTPIYTDRGALKQLAANKDAEETISSNINQQKDSVGFAENKQLSDRYELSKVNKSVESRTVVSKDIDTDNAIVRTYRSEVYDLNKTQSRDSVNQNSPRENFSLLPKQRSPSLEKPRQTDSESSLVSSDYLDRSAPRISTGKQNDVERRMSPSQKRQEIKKNISPFHSKESLNKSEDTKQFKAKKKSPSPIRKQKSDENHVTKPPRSGYRPMLREIMTQTSESLGSFDSDYSRTSSPSGRNEELIAKAEIKVRSTIDYMTDLAMFIVACWLYLFDNELLAIPVLLVMAYRQLQEEISKRIPAWVKRRFRRNNK